MTLSKKIISAFFVIIISNQLFASNGGVEETRSTASQVGEVVQTLQLALTTRDEQALKTIRLYGTDSRYYSMIRGWLFQELVGVESQLHATKKAKDAAKFQAHSNFLK